MSQPSENRGRLPKVLFFAEDVTLAHVGRTLALAQALKGLPVEVVVASGTRYRGLAEATGLRVVPLETMGPAAFAEAIARGAPVYSPARLRQYVANDLALLASEAPQLVVGDFRCSLGISTELAQVPYFSLSSGVWSPHSTLDFPVPELPVVKALGLTVGSFLLHLVKPLIFRNHLAAFNSLRRSLGLKTQSSLQEAYSCGTRTLYADIPELAPTSSLPSGHEYLGPVLWEPLNVLPTWWNEVPTDKPVVYVNFGSSGDANSRDAVLAALAQAPVTVILATVGLLMAELPPHVFSAPYLPGMACARRANLVVCNGGSGTIYQALAAGVPVLAIPRNADQYLCTRALTDQGAGRMLRAGQATAPRVAAEVAMMLDDGVLAQRARALQAQVAAADAPGRFVSLVRDALGLEAEPARAAA